jgi:hypothetical protein
MLMQNRPLGIKVLVPIQILLSIIAIPSGVLLILFPKGDAIGAQMILPYLTQQLPFLRDFAPVGIFLLVVYGLLPIALTYGLWTRKKLAWDFTLLLGVTEIIWIAAEIGMFYQLGFIFFYPLIAGMGVVTIALCLVPSVRRYYTNIPNRPTTLESLHSIDR